jgi:hypothetical protein
MTNIASGTKSHVTLKDGYRWRLFAVLAANLILLYVAAVYDAIQLDGLRAVTSDWEHAWKDIGAVALAAVATTILNGILSADAKARIVFWRWRHPLPGCRAFSVYLKKDVRVDFAALRSALGGLPSDPAKQNALWYRRIYSPVKDDPLVLQVHGDYLFSRDYAGASALFLLVLGAIGVWAIASPKTLWLYLALLAAQLMATTLAAQHYGGRFVATAAAVLQQKGLPRSR